MEDEYEAVARGKLKLKNDSEIKKKKKKKHKNKDKEKFEKGMKESPGNNTISNETIAAAQRSGRQLTKAELSFKKMQEKMVR